MADPRAHAFRSEGVFYEDITNVILDDLVNGCSPKWLMIETHWSVRGGISSVISAQHGDRPEATPHSASS